MKKFLTIAIVAIATVASSVTSYAECSRDLKIVRSYAEGLAGDNSTYYYAVQDQSLFPSFQYTFSVSESNEALNILLGTALANGLTVRVAGDAAACPTFGDERFMGNVLNASSSRFN